jgi:hypothetical protein
MNLITAPSVEPSPTSRQARSPSPRSSTGTSACGRSLSRRSLSARQTASGTPDDSKSSRKMPYSSVAPKPPAPYSENGGRSAGNARRASAQPSRSETRSAALRSPQARRALGLEISHVRTHPCPIGTLRLANKTNCGLDYGAFGCEHTFVAAQARSTCAYAALLIAGTSPKLSPRPPNLSTLGLGEALAACCSRTRRRSVSGPVCWQGRFCREARVDLEEAHAVLALAELLSRRALRVPARHLSRGRERHRTRACCASGVRP